MSNHLRSLLRARTVGAQKQFISELVEYDGVTYEVRQPSVKQRAEIIRASGAQAGDSENADVAALQVQAVIACVVCPVERQVEIVPAGTAPDGSPVPAQYATVYEKGGTEPVYEEADRESLMEQPAGGFVDALGSVALRLMNVDAAKVGKG